MKYVVVLGDGMADWKIERLKNLTCLQAARTPNLDKIARYSEIGLCKTVPDGMKPGSDVANMSVLGFDPRKCYTGRSPLEAVAMGIDLKDTDVTLRCNLVTLSDEASYEDKKMLDYSAGEISTREAAELIAHLKKHLDADDIELFAGISYRHCMLVANGKTGHDLTPPHDISDKAIKKFLPKGPCAERYIQIMKKSAELLANHPVNRERIKQGKRPANSVWLWGEGTKPSLSSFESMRSLKGGVISAVDLVRGIGMLAGMRIIKVDKATGNYDTNFYGKARAAVKALTTGGLDFVYIHMEAPDECGHQGDVEHKIYSIEQIDGKVLGPLITGLDKAGEDYAILVAPDHPTPCACKTHVAEPVPYLIYANFKNLGNGAVRYTEAQARMTGAYVAEGYRLIERLISIK